MTLINTFESCFKQEDWSKNLKSAYQTPFLVPCFMRGHLQGPVRRFIVSFVCIPPVAASGFTGSIRGG